MDMLFRRSAIVALALVMTACGSGPSAPSAPVTQPTAAPGPDITLALTSGTGAALQSGATVASAGCGTQRPSRCTTAVQTRGVVTLPRQADSPFLYVYFHQNDGTECVYSSPRFGTFDEPIRAFEPTPFETGLANYRLDFETPNGTLRCRAPFTTDFIIVRVYDNLITNIVIDKRFDFVLNWQDQTH